MGIAKSFTTIMASAGLVVGLGGVAGATSANIGMTGPYSYNKINASSHTRAWLNNQNNIPVTTTNVQNAVTGNANVSFNTSGGSAMTGEVWNQNSSNIHATVTNNGAGEMLNGWWAPTSDDAVINTTGPSSHNYINLNRDSSLRVTNTNTIPVTTVNTQTAVTGSANVSGNTYGGSAVTGNATNTNTQTVSINVAN